MTLTGLTHGSDCANWSRWFRTAFARTDFPYSGEPLIHSPFDFSASRNNLKCGLAKNHCSVPCWGSLTFRSSNLRIRWALQIVFLDFNIAPSVHITIPARWVFASRIAFLASSITTLHGVLLSAKLILLAPHHTPGPHTWWENSDGRIWSVSC